MSKGLLRVAHLITKLELGGAQQNTLYTVSHLDRSFFEPHLICGEGGLLDEEARNLQGVSLHFCSSLIREIRPWKDWRAYSDLKDLFLRLKPDLVHTHSSKAGILGRIAAADAQVRIIIHTYHGFGFHRFQNPLLFRTYVEAERFACRRANHLIFVSQGNWRWAEQLRLLGNSSASLIRSGVKPDPLLNAKRDHQFWERLGLGGAAKTVGMIACLKPQKDPLTFVEAADIVTQELPEARFILVGDGELRDAVTRRAAQMKHRERFTHFGWRHDVPEFLANLDLMVLPSLWEGLPRVIPEAIIASVPVVASNIDGNREIVLEGRNGALAEPRNPRDFARKILLALRDDWRVDAEFSHQIRLEFDIDEMVRKQEKLYLMLSGNN